MLRRKILCKLLIIRMSDQNTPVKRKMQVNQNSPNQKLPKKRKIENPSVYGIWLMPANLGIIKVRDLQ